MSPAQPRGAAGDRPGVVWFRRDLRLSDNPAWGAATTNHREVVAAFVLEPTLIRPAGALRRDQLFAHLHALHQELSARGGGLVVRRGPATEAIPRLIEECDASSLYVNADASPFAVTRDRAVGQAVTVPMHVFHGSTVHEPGSIVTKSGALSQVFTPFYRSWSARPLPAPATSGPGRAIVLPSEPLPRPQGTVVQAPGETGAWQRLDAWLERSDDYARTRDLVAMAGTSELSADLKFGTLSPRSLVDAVGGTTPGRIAFVRQLAWRDWWAHTLAVHVDLADRELNPAYTAIEWRRDEFGFERWCDGRTGFPIVDAGMRQLTRSGWMHNRVRMICASFLVKDLLIDWRLGERFFRHHLIDADAAQNAGNWQWVAGTGPDAAPYFRVFNPTVQGRKFDPDGIYIRRWLPELSALRAPAIHEPSTADPRQLAEAGIELGRSYPTPIVDHAAARLRAIDAYKRAQR